MARTKSILLFGEGKSEAIFLVHLRRLYGGPNTAIKVEHGRGGSVRTVVESAIKIASLADYTGVLVLLDSDRDDEPIPEKRYKKHRLVIKWCEPCLEALLLEILGDRSLSRLRSGAKAAERCKSHFQAAHLGTDRSGQVLGRLNNALQSKFPNELLDAARTRIPVLDEIIHAIQGRVG
ncbi:MAG: hypothetical protein WCO57_00910 [Verrucomicrobiota bacterium]